MKIAIYIFLSLIYFFGNLLFAQQNTSKEHKIVGYVFGDLMEKAKNPVQAEKLTHLNYAFAKIKNGKISITNEDDPKHFKTLNKLKLQNPSLKLLISVGGWSNSESFSSIANSDSSRTRFANSVIHFLKKYKLDGIDLDWQFPKRNTSTPFLPEYKQNFTLLLDKVRQTLDSFSVKNNHHYLLTIATASRPGYLKNLEIDKIVNVADFINIMCYDYHDDWNTSTCHHTNLLTSRKDAKSYKQSTTQVVKRYIQAGANPSRLVIGIPFYGRGWKKVNSKQNGLYQSAKGPSFSLNYTAIKDSLRSGKYHRYWDEAAQAPYLWNGKDQIFITYDDPVSLKKKAEFIKKENLGGAMFWQYHADDGELLESLYKNLKNGN